MKRITTIILFCLTVTLLIAGCGAAQEEEPMVQMGNPWSEWSSIAEAEAAVDFSFGLPEVVADRYTAVEFRTMNGELLEIIYRDGDSEVCVRKQKGEGQDISGDYNEYENCAEENDRGAAVTVYSNAGDGAAKQLVSYQGYSWSLTASDGLGEDFLDLILE